MSRIPSPEEAWERIAARIEPLPIQSVPRRKAGGRVLATDLEATTDVPAHDVSAMDGYAVDRAVSVGQRLPVDDTIAAGDTPGREPSPGTAARIMTGAPVPSSTFGVVPVEHTDGGDETVLIHAAVPEGAHIRRRGEVVRAGQRLLPAGCLLTPGAQSLLATHGHERVPIHRPPSVATLATGDEVVPPDHTPRPGQLRDSHTDFLLAAGRGLGLAFTPLGIAGDNRTALLEHLRHGLDHDVLLVSGGVSMGVFDLVEPVLEELGCETLLDAVAVQPGKPLVVARHPNGWVFGLPGNPASVMVSFWLFVRPLLRSLQGLRDGFWHGALDGTLSAELPGSKGRDRFLAADAETQDGQAHVRPIVPRGSHDVSAFACGRALVRVRPGSAPAAPGSRCEFLPLPGWPLPETNGG